jgi:anoctamin-1
MKSAKWKLSVFAYELTLAQQYGLIAVCSLPLFYLAGAGAAIFWVLGKIVFHVSYSKRL